MNAIYDRGEVNRARVHVLPTDRFKTDSITVYAGFPLQPETVTWTALLPFVLRRGTQLYPDMKKFRERLDDLYGAGFGFDVFKRGNYQIVQFRMDAVRSRFVSEPRRLLEETIAFLGQTVTQPALEDGKFRSGYVEAEKMTLQKRMESIINDKTRYAAERCVEEMFKGEPYALSPLGRKEDLASIDAASLYEHYTHWLEQALIDIYVVGETTGEEVRALVDEHFRWNRAQCGPYRMAGGKAEGGQRQQANTVVERMDVSQGKLNLGYRTGVTYGSDDYAAALMFNGIFGAYPHSKLFMNVREKASLAYYASSRLDGHIGTMTVQSGIDPRHFERALDIVQEQLERMKQGDFSELEWTQTRAMIVNQLRETSDSAFQLSAFDFNNMLSGRDRTAEQLIAEVMNVSREDVRRVANKVVLDTVYFLRGPEEEGAGT